MKKRNKILLTVTAVVLAVLTAFCLVACNSDKGNSAGRPGNGYSEDMGKDSGKSSIVTTTDRLIVYTVGMNVTTKDLNASLKKMQEKAKEIGGWQARSTEESGYVYVTFKIPTEKLDEFVDAVSEGNSVRNKTVSTVDITEQYLSAETQREELIKERERITALLETDTALTVEDKLSLQKRLTEIAVEIDKYTTEMSGYKKQADYSTVEISMYKEGEYVEPSYWDRLGEVFFGSGKSIGTVFGWLLTAIVAILPYFAIIVGLFGLYVLIKFIVCKAKKIPFTLLKRARENAEIRKEQRRQMRERVERNRAKRAESARPARPTGEDKADKKENTEETVKEETAETEVNKETADKKDKE